MYFKFSQINWYIFQIRNIFLSLGFTVNKLETLGNIEVIVPEGETEETTTHDTLGADKISFERVSI